MKKIYLICCCVMLLTLSGCNQDRRLTSFRLDGVIFTQKYVLKGDELPKTRLISIYSDKTEDEPIDVTKSMISGFDAAKTGKQKVKITFQSIDVSFDVYVVDKVISTTEELDEAISNQQNSTTWFIKAGTYRTSLLITKKLTIFGDSPETTIIKGPKNYDELPVIDRIGEETSDYNAIVAIQNTEDVLISNLSVSGDIVQSSSPSTRNNRYCGVLIVNSSVVLDEVTINDITYQENILGIQNGTGIYIASTADYLHSVVIKNCQIKNFSKTGILIRTGMKEVVIESSIVAGLGNTDRLSQNGIQFASKVRIHNNTIKDLFYNPMTVASCGLLGVYAPYVDCIFTENTFLNVQKDTDFTSFVGE